MNPGWDTSLNVRVPSVLACKAAARARTMKQGKAKLPDTKPTAGARDATRPDRASGLPQMKSQCPADPSLSSSYIDRSMDPSRKVIKALSVPPLHDSTQSLRFLAYRAFFLLPFAISHPGRALRE
jgi:hypothetical protein